MTCCFAVFHAFFVCSRRRMLFRCLHVLFVCSRSHEEPDIPFSSILTVFFSLGIFNVANTIFSSQRLAKKARGEKRELARPCWLMICWSCMHVVWLTFPRFSVSDSSSPFSSLRDSFVFVKNVQTRVILMRRRRRAGDSGQRVPRFDSIRTGFYHKIKTGFIRNRSRSKQNKNNQLWDKI